MKALREWATSSLSVGMATLMHFGLWALIVVAVGSALWAGFRPMPAPAKVAIPESTTTAEGVAEVCVVTWLQAGRDSVEDVRPCFGTVDLRDTKPIPADRIGRAVSVATETVGPGYWSVTVAVDVSRETSGPVAATPTTLLPSSETRYYKVGIRRDGTGYTAVRVPEPTGSPVGGVRPRLKVGTLDRPASNDPVATTVQDYLTALLAGEGELSRFVWPGATILPVAPAPFVSVALHQIAAVDLKPLRKEVLAEAVGTDHEGRTQTFSVSLEVARRQGRWEVAKTLPAPTLAADQPTASSTTVPRPTTTTATRLPT